MNDHDFAALVEDCAEALRVRLRDRGQAPAAERIGHEAGIALARILAAAIEPARLCGGGGDGGARVTVAQGSGGAGPAPQAPFSVSVEFDAEWIREVLLPAIEDAVGDGDAPVNAGEGI